MRILSAGEQYRHAVAVQELAGKVELGYAILDADVWPFSRLVTRARPYFGTIVARVTALEFLEYASLPPTALGFGTLFTAVEGILRWAGSILSRVGDFLCVVGRVLVPAPFLLHLLSLSVLAPLLAHAVPALCFTW